VDGAGKDPGCPDVGGSMTGAVVLAVALLAATVFGLVWRRRDGRVRPAAAPATTHGTETGDRVDPAVLAALGATPGGEVTLLQFSSAFCAPCRTARVVLSEVAAQTPGVRHVEVDAESHLDAVRALDILRTPTTLVLDGDGRIRARASGAPRKTEVLAALVPLLGTDVPAPGTGDDPPGKV
jgi:thiol-disulfide isomerase/thioredoxin